MRRRNDMQDERWQRLLHMASGVPMTQDLERAIAATEPGQIAVRQFRLGASDRVLLMHLQAAVSDMRRQR